MSALLTHLPASPVCLPQSMSTLLTRLPTSPVCPPQSMSALLTRLPASIHVHSPHPSAHLTHPHASPLSACLSPCPPSSPRFCPPRLSAHLSPCPPSSPVCLPQSMSLLLTRLPSSPVCPPQPCLLSSPVCPFAHGPPSSPWSKCLTRLRRDQPFPGGLASGRHPPWSKDQGSGGQQSGSRRCSCGPRDTASRTHTAPQAGGRPCVRVGKRESAVASAGSSGKGSPSRTQRAPDFNRA